MTKTIAYIASFLLSGSLNAWAADKQIDQGFEWEQQWSKPIDPNLVVQTHLSSLRPGSQKHLLRPILTHGQVLVILRLGRPWAVITSYEVEVLQNQKFALRARHLPRRPAHDIHRLMQMMTEAHETGSALLGTIENRPRFVVRALHENRQLGVERRDSRYTLSLNPRWFAGVRPRYRIETLPASLPSRNRYELHLWKRVSNRLTAAGISTLGQLLAMDETDLFYSGIGVMGIKQIKHELSYHGLKLGEPRMDLRKEPLRFTTITTHKRVDQPKSERRRYAIRHSDIQFPYDPQHVSPSFKIDIGRIRDHQVSAIELPSNVYNALEGAGIHTVGQLVARTEKRLRQVVGLGSKGLAIIENELARRSLSFGVIKPGLVDIPLQLSSLSMQECLELMKKK